MFDIVISKYIKNIKLKYSVDREETACRSILSGWLDQMEL